MNFIEQFYFGNIEPQRYSPELESAMKKELKILTNIEEQLLKNLKGQDKELFLSFTNEYNGFTAICSADSFISGFRLGAQFTHDTFIKTGEEN